MTVDLFLKLLLVISTATSLFTEAVKKQLEELKKEYSSNLLAGIVAVVVGACVCVAYTVYSKIALDATVLVSYGILIAFSWLVSMIGYDKVVQTIQQLIGGGKK